METNHHLTHHDIVPGDYVLLESWGILDSDGTINPGFKSVFEVETVAKNYVTDKQGNKFSFSCIYGVPCNKRFLDMFDFVSYFIDEESPCPTHVYQRNRGVIKIVPGGYTVMDVSVAEHEGKTCTGTMLHEFQHLYFDATGEDCKLKLKEK
jgi:hypothetical protein